ncbi:hypothetical protein AGABI1DRAFT_135289 [Agaricus bisporus var. burnettii JB137-S8]|uniref:Uncharacterized protein n=1 Tax=Agaricus bisporus var. burnettii (strain JB137-S8 / ATCC MYA-4627 / FGSC 10392) TaxID=597362 RepID=K5VFZ4_AGABU|nr:uncharacterized protein AGABI1DRAFT_135289 [Agaricus bisporus var. burnettii JB137-S8]EKM73229.1 hypothetical protein AGABI1DRAFT_135289 [Agaricus bisporus var. burnettii JB137-S8]
MLDKDQGVLDATGPSIIVLGAGELGESIGVGTNICPATRIENVHPKAVGIEIK